MPLQFTAIILLQRESQFIKYFNAAWIDDVKCIVDLFAGGASIGRNERMDATRSVASLRIAFVGLKPIAVRFNGRPRKVLWTGLFAGARKTRC